MITWWLDHPAIVVASAFVWSTLALLAVCLVRIGDEDHDRPRVNQRSHVRQVTERGPVDWQTDADYAWLQDVTGVSA